MITKNKIGLIFGPVVFFLIKLFYEPSNLSDEGLAILASLNYSRPVVTYFKNNFLFDITI